MTTTRNTTITCDRCGSYPFTVCALACEADNLSIMVEDFPTPSTPTPTVYVAPLPDIHDAIATMLEDAGIV